MLPQPVLIIGTYNADGTPNAMNAAWGGQWDRGEIMISMGAHATTENLARCADFTVAFATKDTMVASDFVGIVSAKNDPDKMKKTVNDDPIQFIFEFSSILKSVFTDRIYTYEKITGKFIAFTIIKCDYIGKIVVLQIFLIYIQYIIV